MLSTKMMVQADRMKVVILLMFVNKKIVTKQILQAWDLWL